MDQEDTDKWLDMLAGRRQPESAADEQLVTALRAMLEAETRETADEVGLRRLIRRLQSEGLLAESGKAKPKVNRPLLLATAASLVAVAITLSVWNTGGPYPYLQSATLSHEGLRGSTAAEYVIRLTSREPQETRSRLVAQLEAASIRFEESTSGPDTLMLTLSVDQTALGPFAKTMSGAGIAVVNPGPYRIVITRP